MRVQRSSLRKGSAALAQRDSARPESPMDAWLTRLSSASQPLLLCLAVFGYFYTVVPVYQKELLSEQIAAKEIELTRLQRAIDATAPTMKRLEGERAALERQLQALKAQKDAAERTIAELNLRQSSLEARTGELEAARAKLMGDVASVEAGAKAFSLRAYHDSFSGSVIFQYLRGVSDPYKIVEAPTYDAISEYLLTPYAAVSSLLALGDSKFIESAASVPRHVKDEYHTRVRAALEARKDTLSKHQDDVSALLVQIKEGLASAAVDPTPGDRFNELMYETKARLVKMLQDSRQREWDRTKRFLESVIPGPSK